MAHEVSVPLGTQAMSFETGRMATYSNGSCVVRLGDSMVLAAVAEGKQGGPAAAGYSSSSVAGPPCCAT